MRHRLRLEPPRWRSVRWWLAVVVGIVLGGLTHIVWDAFTHVGRWGSDLVPALSEHVGPMPLTQWLQYASGVAGLAGIVWWWRAVQRRRTPEEAPPRAARLRGPLRLLPVAGAAAGLVLCLATVTSDTEPARVLVRAVTLGGLGIVAGLLTLALVWHVAVSGVGASRRVRRGR
jgi:hypothetical protein